MTAAEEEPLLLAVPRSSARALERALAAGLLAVSRADGGRPTPEAARILRELHNAAHGHRSSVPGTPPAAPTTVDSGLREVLGMGEAAAVLGCTPEYARRLARTGRLPAQRVGGVWAVRPEDLDALRYGRTEDTSGKPGPARRRAADRG
ncbi:helix-turn-helix domain-containing protein [Streptomyces sp. C1-2]|uniref:helix-turn-helix domain-containing protein n=1 Tax=Streptomyces sp. C1-2 TaxID=2720022 RepID=UPI0014324A1D|nr:helix-turn-helix domain-containing protein [Streptomyces sp. C1-2]NJP72167.1 helix-turn-helix domain-containing protein [Streptomyces sp. C1-2]